MSTAAVVDPSQVELGNSLPPYGPHTVTMHAPGWDAAMQFRNGDTRLMTKMKSIYPRFSPWGPSRQLYGLIGQKIGIPPGHGCAAFLSPEVWATNQEHATNAIRKEHKLEVAELKYYAVEINGVRLYVVAFPMQKSMGAIFEWQHGGLGFSTRASEGLLQHQEKIKILGEVTDVTSAPEPTYLTETESHSALRERIAELMMRACAVEHKLAVRADDVTLYQTGMAAIHRLHDAIVSLRSGPTVVFGAVFHSTYHLFEESASGIKHYGAASDTDVDDFEKYLGGGGECGYVFTEFPSNPVMVSVDLMRLRKLADTYGFFLVADDTCASFANIDLLAAADVVVTSLTKSFSGYADVMAGSVVLNPNSTRAYVSLKPKVSSRFHNELFEGDAAHLLANNKDFFPRTILHNRNATAVASYFNALVEQPGSPVTKVCYPPHSKGSRYLECFMRKPTNELPQPGYGCLLSIEFDTLEHLITFYDSVNLFCGPHLGAHLTICMPYNAMVYGKEHPELHAEYGLKQEQLRIAVGYEDSEGLLQRCKDAYAKLLKTMT
ncbi:cystathionine gamma-synthase [Xylariaceae sp. FL1272]|nr:cystathionine gamma-synthase [Xylariaceae sp. FL1272]